MRSAEEMREAVAEVSCPFCNDDGFDLPGLAGHIDGHCDVAEQARAEAARHTEEFWAILDARATAIRALKTCDKCGATPVRENLDGEDLCQACCEKWVRGEGMALREERPEE